MVEQLIGKVIQTTGLLRYNVTFSNGIILQGWREGGRGGGDL